MLDEMGKSIDAVTVSTPDHMHAAAALMAMRMGKHCFCQKPLTHTIYEARADGRGRPREEGRHADGQPGHGRRAACARRPRWSRPACSATVKEVHVWTNRPIWPQGGDRAASRSRCPPNLRLGPVARPGARAALRRRLSSVRVARLVGLRHRRAGRHGLPHRQHALHGPRPARTRPRCRPRPRATTGQLSRSGRSSTSSSRPTTGARP